MILEFWQKAPRQTWRADLWARRGEETRGREQEGEGGTNGESSMETNTVKCKVDCQWKFAV